jgi:plasmid stabilization system protein ParE
MKSDEQPLTRYRMEGIEYTDCLYLRPQPEGEELEYPIWSKRPDVYLADEADRALAAKDARIAELESEMAKLMDFHRTGEWMADIQPDRERLPEQDLSDPPVTRRELAAVLRAYAEEDSHDYWAMVKRLERGQDARGEL